MALFTQLGKPGVFRQEAVPRMDGLGAGGHRRRQDGRHIQVAVLYRGRADADALVGKAHMKSLPVRLRKDRHRGDAHLLAGADDPHRDLAPVGDEYFCKQGESSFCSYFFSTRAKENSPLTASFPRTRPSP